MNTATQVDGLAGTLLRCLDEPDRIPLLQGLLDRYCHRLRNRLNSMKLSLYLSRRLSGEVCGPEWARADLAYRTIEMMIDQVQLFCNPLHAMPVEGDLEAWIRDNLGFWESILENRPARLELVPPEEPLPTQFDWYRLGQGIHGLILFWAGQDTLNDPIRLSCGREGDSIILRFDSESPIIRPEGSRENLALPVLARVVKAHRGDLQLSDSGTSVIMTWPSPAPLTSSG